LKHPQARGYPGRGPVFYYWQGNRFIHFTLLASDNVGKVVIFLPIATDGILVIFDLEQTDRDL
jgi:hypothetical protein